MCKTAENVQNFFSIIIFDGKTYYQGEKSRLCHSEAIRRGWLKNLNSKYFADATSGRFAARYDSFSTLTLICAVTSRNTLMVTWDSPIILIGSASCTCRLSTLNPCAASPSAMSAEVTDPNI